MGWIEGGLGVGGGVDAGGIAERVGHGRVRMLGQHHHSLQSYLLRQAGGEKSQSSKRRIGHCGLRGRLLRLAGVVEGSCFCLAEGSGMVKGLRFTRRSNYSTTMLWRASTLSYLLPARRQS